MEPLVHEIMSQHNEKDGPVKIGSRGTFISWLLKYLPEEYKTPERIGTDQMLVRQGQAHSFYAPNSANSLPYIICRHPHDELNRYSGGSPIASLPPFVMQKLTAQRLCLISFRGPRTFQAFEKRSRPCSQKMASS